MNSYDETPRWCQVLWPWFGPPWYAEIEDPDVAGVGRTVAPDHAARTGMTGA